MPDINWNMSLAGVIVGFVIGLTGMGGGALMTPVLVIFFNVNPAAAVSSDVVTSLILKPFGGSIHVRRGTVNWRLVRWLMIGSVPMAFLGAFLLDQVIGKNGADAIKRLLGWVLLVAAGAILAKVALQARRRDAPNDKMLHPEMVRPLPTLLIGAAGGLIVGLTSVGSGSLMIVMLMVLYPMLSSKEMVGTDLIQAIPLVGAAALGHMIFGSPQLELITSVLIGAIPAVMVGAHFSSKASDRYIRPILCAVLTISAVKLLEPEKNAFNGLVLALAIAFIIVFIVYALFMRAADRAAAHAAHLAAADAAADATPSA
jgi:uncharacterized membrane protein YfcA